MELGADLSVKNDDHQTALHMASMKGHMETVKALVEMGAGQRTEGEGQGRRRGTLRSTRCGAQRTSGDNEVFGGDGTPEVGERQEASDAFSGLRWEYGTGGILGATWVGRSSKGQGQNNHSQCCAERKE